MNRQSGSTAAEAAKRSATYRALAQAATYQGAQASAFAISGADYCEAFDPAVNPDACPLREAAHVGGDPGALFEELTRFYQYFGLHRRTASEMPDHLAVELEFMHFLTHLEDTQHGLAAPVEALWRAQRDFLARHLARLVTAAVARSSDRHPACRALVVTCLEFVTQELQQLQARLAGPSA